MANKNKIINQAQKFIAKAQWDKAIKELQKAIDLDPGDVRTLLKLGDVYSKQGDRENATKTYKEVAHSYSEQGFFLKAVAVHKQILKHDGNNLEVRLKLAELYEQLGLSSEAQSQYQEVARIHDDKGDTQGSLDVLKRLVDLDSENVASRIKLAEGYSRAGQVEEAVKAFAKAAEVLKRQNRVDDYVKVAERLVYHDPERITVIRDLARLYLSRGDTKRGLAKLQLCFKAQPRDIETLTLLAQAFHELGQVQKTVFVYKELAAVHADNGSVQEARAAQQKILELDPNDVEALNALQPRSNVPMSAGPASHPAPQSAPMVPNSAPMGPQSTPPFPTPSSSPRPRLASDLAPPTFAPRSSPASQPMAPSFAPRTRPPSSMGAPPLSTPSFAPNLSPRRAPEPTPAPVPSSDEIQFDEPVPVEAPLPPPEDNDTERAIQDIITETDVFVRYGLADKALGHLRKVFDLDPDNVLAHEKMRQIHEARGDSARAAEAVANIMHAHARTGDLASLEQARTALADLAPGHPLAQGGLPGAIPPPTSARDDDDLSIDIIEDSGVFNLDDFGDSTNAEGVSAAVDSFEPPDDFALAQDPTDAAPIPSSSPFVDGPSFEGFQPAEASTDLPQGGWDQPEAAEDDDNFVFEDSEATMAAPGLGQAQPTGTDQAPLEEAPWTPPKSEDPFAENVVTELPVQPLQTAGGAFAEPDEPESELSGDGQDVTEEGPAVEVSAPEEGSASLEDEIEEALFFIQNGLVDEARDTLTLVLNRAPHHEKARDLLSTLDLQAMDPESLESTEELDTPPSPSESEVEAAFADLPADEPADPDEDPENQYDMGMVMMEMTRLDDAIAAFEKASHAPSRMLSALEMMGHCYREKQQPLESIEFYAQALERGAEGPAATNLMFEIGAAYEQAAEYTLALQWMEKCAADDPHHRDVASRIAALASQVGLPNGASQGKPSEHPQPRSSKKNKISYL